MIVAASERCWAEVDLNQLERNVGLIRSALPKKDLRFISVVKADAYGHGLNYLVPRLMACGVDYFAVANVAEGSKIRELGVGWPILILSPILPEELSVVSEYDLTLAISSHQELEMLENAALGEVNIHLKVDTGMGRSGVWYRDAETLLRAIEVSDTVKLTGLFTHFASSDQSKSYTRLQRERFFDFIHSSGVLNRHADLIIHADNSSGLDTFDDGEGSINAIRVGGAQLGVVKPNSQKVKDMGTAPIMTLRARIGLVKELPKDTPVSYDRTYVLERDSRIALITAGYGDGINMGLSNSGKILIHGKRYPIIGRVTMDQAVVDITDSDDEILVGDVATLIGSDGDDAIRIEDWACWSGTIELDLYCSITKRVVRKYL